nr:MAG TPA: hypothetical protein [Caudoviricetes sp.]
MRFMCGANPHPSKRSGRTRIECWLRESHLN